MEVDPLASMRCWAIELELGGRTFEVPALPAADWWPVLALGDVGRILDFVVSDPEDPFNLDELLLAGEVSGEDLTEVLLDAMEETAGRSFHAAYVLATVAGMHWPSINGALVQRGFQWDDQPLGAALDALYCEITGRMDKDPLDKFLALLANDSLTTGKRRNPERVVREFESMAGPRPTAGAVATGGPSDNARPRTQPRRQPPRQAVRSIAPRPRRAPRAESGPPASSESRSDGVAPTSDTVPPPPL